MKLRPARLLGQFVHRGSVYKGLKPVHWCIHCETALAEAEVEYSEHVSPAVYVRFPVTGGLHGLDVGSRPVSVLIWTTTPWTLPANMGLCFHPEFEYALLETRDEVFILASELVPRVSEECGIGDYRILGRLRGAALGGLECRHPWISRRSAVVFGNHVTLEQGTGVVHTAPGHGEEDYRLGVDNGLEVYCPVDDSGRFLPAVDHFGGMPVFEANRSINALMAREGHLLRGGAVPAQLSALLALSQSGHFPSHVPVVHQHGPGGPPEPGLARDLQGEVASGLGPGAGSTI